MDIINNLPGPESLPVQNPHPPEFQGSMGMLTTPDEQMMQQENMALQAEQMMMPQQQQDNPFDAQRYQNVQVPDVPISMGGSMAEQLLNDNEVPEEVKKRFWFVFHKDNVLTFLDEKRKNSKLINFDIAKIDILNSMSYYDYTFEKELEFGVIRNVLETKLDRALGFKGGNTKNERIMLQSQFTEQRQISEDGNVGAIKEGFFKRLLGRR